MADSSGGLGGRLRELRGLLANRPSARIMAMSCGISPMSWHHYEVDGVSPPAAVYGKIADTTGCNILWLMYGKGKPFGPQPSVEEERLSYGSTPVIAVVGPDGLKSLGAVEAEASRCVAVPILGGSIAAGVPRDVFEAEIDGWAICYSTAVRHPRQTSCVRVAGDSMEPFIPDGSLVGIDHSLRDPRALLDRFVALRVDDGCVIRRLVKADGSYLGLPANLTPENRPVVFTAGRAAENPVVGKVIFSFAVFT